MSVPASHKLYFLYVNGNAEKVAVVVNATVTLEPVRTTFPKFYKTS